MIGRSLDTDIGRLLIALTYLSVLLLVIGVLAMAVAGVSPLAHGPRFDLAAVPAQLIALSPAGFLWVGLLAVIATPVSRVLAAAIGSFRTGDRWLLLVAIAIMTVIAIAVATALLSEA